MSPSPSPEPTLLQTLKARIRDLDGHPLRLTDDEIDALRPEDMDELIQEFGSTVLVELPPREQEFLNWLRLHDPAVIEELWPEGEPRVVSLAHLPRFRRSDRGFPICDLEHSPNYFFTSRHVKPEGLRHMGAIFHKIERNQPLSLAEALLFEMMAAPMDLWHFCRKYEVPLDRARAKIAELVSLDVLVHLPDRSDLERYLEDE